MTFYVTFIVEHIEFSLLTLLTLPPVFFALWRRHNRYDNHTFHKYKKLTKFKSSYTSKEKMKRCK